MSEKKITARSIFMWLALLSLLGMGVMMPSSIEACRSNGWFGCGGLALVFLLLFLVFGFVWLVILIVHLAKRNKH